MGKKGKSLDYQTIIRIKKLYDEGSTMREIKDKTGLSLGTVFKYLNNEKEQTKTEGNQEQSINQLEALEGKIKQFENRLNQLDQKINLLMETPKPVKKEIIPSPIPKVNNANQLFFTTSKIITLVKTATGSQPSNDTIQRVMKQWRGNNPNFNSKQGYPLDALLINLKAWNQKSKDRDKLDFSELENLTV